jgi:F-type H+-transporting ATPase subunit c
MLFLKIFEILIFAAVENPTVICNIPGLKFVGAGLATISVAGTAIGIGIVFGCFMLAYSKRPEMKNELFFYALLGFALSEAIALFGLLMAFIILYA